MPFVIDFSFFPFYSPMRVCSFMFSIICFFLWHITLVSATAPISFLGEGHGLDACRVRACGKTGPKRAVFGGN